MENIEKKIKELPPDLQKEVEKFVDSLHVRQLRRRHGKLKFDWAGALHDLRGKYTSVELQHKISAWRIGEK